MAELIKKKLKNKPSIINLIDFYLPLRGNRRRKSSQAAEDTTSDNDTIQKELYEIERHYDFDVPSAIDWDLLVVINLINVDMFE